MTLAQRHVPGMGAFMGMKVECAKPEFKTVDLFAGPGGLAEGFSAFRRANGKKIFDIALSVEKEPGRVAKCRARNGNARTWD